ncbi:unnamed protein product [Rotaria sp. Silwood1]|nr:unnamed protein product [Rotaria sp. Silwood1]
MFTAHPWSDEPEQWQKYTDAENEIIEDAYKEQRPQVKIDDGYVLDFKQQIQYEKDDQHRQHPIKRVQLERDRNNVHIREERFSSSVTLTSTSTAESRTISDQLTIWQKNNLASADYECKLENKNNTLADIVEEEGASGKGGGKKKGGGSAAGRRTKAPSSFLDFLPEPSEAERLSDLSSRHAPSSRSFIVICTIIYYTESTVYDITTSSSNWQSILSNLKPGDIAVMHQGTYTTSGSGYFQLTLNGQLTQPIIIQGAPNEARPIIENPNAIPDAQNILNIQGSNFMLKHLAFTKGSRGIRIGPAGYQIYNNAVNGPIDALGIQSTGTFNVERNVFFDPNKMDLYPAVGSPLINAGVHIDSQLVTYDFNGKSRSNSKPSVGAYVS